MRSEIQSNPGVPTFSELQKGGDEVWEKFYTSQKPKVIAHANAWGQRNDAEDLLHDTFEAVIKRVKKTDVPALNDANSQGYVFRTLENKLRNKHKKGQHPAYPYLVDEFKNQQGDVAVGSGQSLFDSQQDNKIDVEGLVGHNASVKEELIKMEKIFSKDSKWPTMILLTAEGYSYEEIAEELHVPVGTVQSGLSRARKRVQEAAGEIFDKETLEYHNSHLRKPAKK